MSEEEKKITENLKKNRGVSFKEADVLSNLLDKQQKEIEELKDNLEKFEVSFALCVNDRDSKAEMIKNSISKDKIRERITQLELLDKQYYKKVIVILEKMLGE